MSRSIIKSSIAISTILAIPMIVAAQGWTAAPASPPSSNASYPLNVGATNQAKSGGLQLGSLVSTGDAIIRNIFVGDVGHGTNWAGLSHSSSNTSTGYALLQSNDGLYTLINKASGAGHIGFRVGNADMMIINGSGNVGIGTASPTSKLHVVGDVNISSGSCYRVNGTCIGTGGTTGSGTTNYVSKWTSASALGNSQIFDNGTNVGIGTAGPSYQLHLARSAYTAGLTPSFALSNSHGNAITMDAYTNNTPGGYAGANLGGSVRVLLSPVPGDPNWIGMIGTANNSGMAILTNGTQRISVSAAGNVGIGTTNPGARLDVLDSVIIGNAAWSRLYLRDDESTSGPKSIHANSNVAGFLNGGGSWMAYWDTAGNMQNQGQINATNYLAINGKYAIDGTDSWLRLNQQNSFTSGVYTPYNFRSDGGYYGGGTVRLRENTSVTGSVTASAFYYSSDETLKKNIEPLSGSLSNILKLDGVSFDWKEGDKKSIGVVAQNIEKVYPELVSIDEETGLKSVEYGNLVAPLIEAIKEQQAQIDALKAEIENLKSN